MHAETFAPNIALNMNVACAARQPKRLGMAGAALLLAAACGLAHADVAADARIRTEAVGSVGTTGTSIDLTNAQMDRVAAGFQQSTSAATASALLGITATTSSTYASATGPIYSTGSYSAGVAGGIGADATAGAATRFR